MKIILLILLFFPANFVFGYTPETTHAGLSEQAVYFYNSRFFTKLSEQEKEFIIKGSIAEDVPVVRALNHFYDPIRNIGMNNFRTAKGWATDNYTENIYTWPEAVRLYSEGDKDKAFVSLGHIIHLIQDMTVPDHSRNDAHGGAGVSGLYTGESSYESWSSDNKSRRTLSGLGASFQNLNPTIFQKIEEYFDFLANYSNRNFFGDNSINNKVYQYKEPQATGADSSYLYGTDRLDNQKFKLIKKIYSRQNDISFVLSDDNDTSVLSGYFDRLSKQAILAGAGVIDLFLREGEIARAEYLRAQALQAETEIKKAIELNKNLSEMGSVKLILFGLNSIIKYKVTAPIQNTAQIISDGFSSGSKIVYSQFINSSSFLAFSSEVVIKTAIANTKEAIGKIISSTEKFTSENYRENLASIPETTTIFSTPAVAVPVSPIIENEEIKLLEQEEAIAEEELEDNTSSLLSLSNALSLLGELSNNLSKQPIVVIPRTFAISTPYSPGFGGGEETQLGTEGSKLDENPLVSEDGPLGEPSAPADESPGENLGITSDQTDDNEEIDTSVVASTTESMFESIVEVFEEILPDMTSPDISLYIRECADSISLDGCFVATSSLSIFWSSNADDLSYFEINKNGEISTTTATSTIILGQDRSLIDVSVSAVDASGNTSESIKKTAEIFLSPVIINEVAWNGTTGHPEDEWIELYNRTDKTIDLSGWILYSKTDSSPYIKLEGEINPNSYYLIERKNDCEEDEPTQSPIRNIEADIWISFGAGLSNAGENLILSYSSTTIDELPFFSGWAGKSSDRSFERIDPDKGNDVSNWTTNNWEIRNGVTVSGSAVFGTPKARSSANYLINKNLPITKDLILEKKNNPYYVLKNSFVRINEGASLFIEPGVVIKFAEGGGVVADGNLISTGTKEEPIVFTSLRDDEYGGDTNRDGVCDKNNASSTASCPYPGSFHGIWFSEKSASSTIKNSIFRYGGIADGTRRSLVYIEDTSLNLSDSTFEYSATNGVNLTRSNSTVHGNSFNSNSSDSSYAGLKATGGTPNIENNIFLSNAMGIYSINSDADILNNKFSKNKYRAIHLVNKPGGKILGNISLDEDPHGKNNQITISGSLSVSNSTTTLMSNPMPYFLYGTVSVVASSTLYIGEGTRIINSYSGSASRLSINGNLIVDGNKENPVVFLSDLADGVKNSWAGILLHPGSSSYIKGAIFKDATKAISYYKSPINLEDVEFSNNTLGVFIGSSPSLVEKAINVYFDITNLATTSPRGLW